MRAIPLHGRNAAGRVALVDDEDFGLVSQYRWYPRKPKKASRMTYAACNYTRDGKPGRIMMHMLITGWPMTDHIDHDGLNNQRANLRPVTVSQNAANMRANRGASSDFKGVWWAKKERVWRAGIQYQYKKVTLGSFDSEEAAARAYDAAARRLAGSHAYLNFPDPPPEQPKRTPESVGAEIRFCECGYWVIKAEGPDGAEWQHLLPSTVVCPPVQGSSRKQSTWEVGRQAS